jgi:Polyketide cyclase / dehydrase and lipid transport
MSPKPVSVSIEVPQSRTEVYDFLDVMANHEPFTDHMLVDWSYSGPPRGVGSKAHVHSRFGALKEAVDIEVVGAEAPSRIVEHNVSAKGRRLASGTYELADLPTGGTRITFTYAWRQAPAADRLLAPLIRGVLRRGNEKAMARLKEQLPASSAHERADAI